MKKIVALLILGGLLATSGVASAKKAKPVVVFEDDAGDAGLDPTGPLPGVGDLGFDLVKGSIVRKGKNLEFTVEHAAMPSSGTLGEVARFLWHISVDGEQYRFTVKSIDIGKPDILAGSGTERLGQIDVDGHFRLETCVTESAGITLVNCTALEYLDGVFDPATKSFTIILPLKSVKAKPGSIITQGTGGAGATCPICWASHVAERSLTPTSSIDSTSMQVEYKVPR